MHISGFGTDFLCGRIPGLTSKQREICERSPDTIIAVGEGTKLSLKECQRQFQNYRWNCSVIETGVGYIILNGSPEAAFLYAISSAGVTYTIAQACSRGNISSCGCSPPSVISASPTTNTNNVNQLGPAVETDDEWTLSSRWKWGGCSTDITSATRLARIFLDSREIEGDARSLMNLHNNKAGRKAVQKTLETQCKCHGLSGSCTLKTCWLKLAPFRIIGAKLMEKYRNAEQVIAGVSPANSSNSKKHKKRNSAQHGRQSLQQQQLQLFLRPKSNSIKNIYKKLLQEEQQGSLHRKLKRRQNPNQRKKQVSPKHYSLVYLETSPSYCEPNQLKGIIGTKGRICQQNFDDTSDNNNTNGNGSVRVRNEVEQKMTCELLCCGRGYSTHQILRKWRCRCKFIWCCKIECDDCEQLVEIYTCN